MPALSSCLSFPQPRRHPLAHAALLTGLLATALPCAHAQQPPTASAARHTFDIPAGPLAAALRRAASQAAVVLVFTPAQTEGRTTAGVRGSHTAQEALSALLAGTGLNLVRTDAGSYVLQAAPAPGTAPRPAPAAQMPALREVTVSAQPEQSSATEGSGSYAQGAASHTATRLGLTLRETPQSLTIVTRQKIDDFSLDSVDKVLESTSAVYIQRQGVDGAQYFGRGFRLQSQYDGIPNPLGIGEDNFGPSPDSAIVDRVEILQGAAGLMSGAGDPGGTINLVRKRPTAQRQASVEAQLGSFNKRRLVGDVSGPLTPSGSVRGRAVVFADHSDAFTDHVFDNRQGFYGIVEADLTDDTLLAASVTYQRNRFNSHYGVPMAPRGADLGLPRSSFFGIANGDTTRETLGYTLDLTQRLGAEWQLRAALRHGSVSVDGTTSYLGGTLDQATGGGLRVWGALQQRETRSNVLDAHASGPVQAFGRRHELVFGASASELKYRNRLADYESTDFNLYHFDRASVMRPGGTLPDWPTADTTRQQGVYGVVRANLTDSLKAILGTRVSWYEFKAAGVQDQKEDAVVTPYAGLVYDFHRNYSLYASYSDIFKPQSNLTAAGGRVVPVVGKNYELGVKAEFLQRRLNASAAVFQLEQTHLAEVDASVPYDEGNICRGSCYNAAGLVVSKGVDLSLHGEPARGWQVGAGYTYVRSEYRSGEMRGQAWQSHTPDSLLRAYGTYRLAGTGWTVGGNIRLQSRISTHTDSFAIRQKAYAVVGLMARYQIGRQADVLITLNNLFDRRYYDSIGSYSTRLENIYGAPRNLAASLRYRF